MEHNKAYESLARIERVDPPPFLFTRIEAHISAQKQERMPLSWALSLGFTLVVILLLNGSILLRYSTDDTSTNGLNALAAEMQIQTSDQLYDE